MAIVDELAVADRSPVELRRVTRTESNLLAHHLDVLEYVGLVRRKHSSGDGRRRYVQLRRDALAGLGPSAARPDRCARRRSVTAGEACSVAVDYGEARCWPGGGPTGAINEGPGS